MRKVYVAGGATTPFIGKLHPDFIWKGHPDFGKRENPTLGEHLHRAIGGALEDTGASPDQVERVYVGNFAGELFTSQGHLGALAAAYPGFDGKPCQRVEGACASGGLALANGVDAIRAGRDVVMVTGAEVQTTVSARQGADYLARAADYARQRDIDAFTFPALFARRARAVVESGAATMDDLALAAVKAYGNAGRNPLAHMRAVEMSFERASQVSDQNPAFLGNEALRPFLRVSDCSQVSDGASALLLCSEEGLARLGRRPADAVEIAAIAVTTAPLDEDPAPTRLDNVARAARQAYAEAGVGPGDVNVAEVHDCFTVAEILAYEALGFADAGQGAQILRDGTTAIDGRLPVNPGGGLVGFGHPVGATGVKQAHEIYRQLRGQAGDYQVPGRPTLGLSENMGGDDRTAVVTIYRAG